MRSSSSRSKAVALFSVEALTELTPVYFGLLTAKTATQDSDTANVCEMCILWVTLALGMFQNLLLRNCCLENFPQKLFPTIFSSERLFRVMLPLRL